MAASAYFSTAQPFFGHFMAILCVAAPTHGRIRSFSPRSTVFRPRFGVLFSKVLVLMPFGPKFHPY
jgi:hypothetical protein